MNEIWKDISNYEGLYKISNRGRVFSKRTNKILKDVSTGSGYRSVSLSDYLHKKKRYYIHRLVAIAFLGIPRNLRCVVNHKNLNKKDNNVENLEWVTPEENMAHAYNNGKIDYRRPMRCDNTTGVKGVSPHRGGFQVEICGHYVGWYKDMATAHFARWDAERSLYGKNI